MGPNLNGEESRRTIVLPSFISDNLGTQVPNVFACVRSDPNSPNEQTFSLSVSTVNVDSFDVVVHKICNDNNSTWNQNLMVDYVVVSDHSIINNYKQESVRTTNEFMSTNAVYGTTTSSNYVNDPYIQSVNYQKPVLPPPPTTTVGLQNQYAPTKRTLPPTPNYKLSDFFETPTSYTSPSNQSYQPAYSHTQNQSYDYNYNHPQQSYYNQPYNYDAGYNTYQGTSTGQQSSTYLDQNSYQGYDQVDKPHVVNGIDLVKKLRTLTGPESKMDLLLLYSYDEVNSPLKDFELGDVVSEFHTGPDRELALSTIISSRKLTMLRVDQVLDVINQFDANSRLSALADLAPFVSDLVNAKQLVDVLPTEYDKQQAKP
ncbi:hypothetical protein AKO1_014443, partial [Acrasis kona]